MWICRLDNAASNIAENSGLRIIEAILEGERDAVKLAELSGRRVEKKKSEIASDQESDFRTELIVALGEWHEHYQFYNQRLTKINKKIYALPVRYMFSGMRLTGNAQNLFGIFRETCQVYFFTTP
jgi:hypothetical protein